MRPVMLSARGGEFLLRRAIETDVPALAALLVDDAIGAGREDASDLEPYLRAFRAVDADPAHLLVLAEDAGGSAVATLQLTLIPGLSRHGALRAQVEAVRVAASRRGSGLGSALMRWAIEESRARGAGLLQLTSDLRREDAHRFYQRLGFVGSHLGMKLDLASD